MKSTILVLVDWFDPAYKAGGPITSCVNFVKALEGYYTIKVLTSSYDLDGTVVVDASKQSRWIRYGSQTEVYYTANAELSYSGISAIIKQVNPDFLYCNGMFSVPFTIYPLWIKMQLKTSANLVLAPRGMLKSSALSYKPLKKKIFLSLVKLSGIIGKIKFQATDESESKDIAGVFGDAKIVLAGNFPATVGEMPDITEKMPGKLNLLFLGRVHEIKQLHYLLDRLMEIQDDIKLTIIGPIEDADYWEICKDKINYLPANIQVDYLGERNPTEIHLIFQGQHVMALPTQGENFGHSIFESFANGKPVIISDRTPWVNLEKEETGFDCALTDPKAFVQAIQFFTAMDQAAYDKWSINAYQKAKKYHEQPELLENYYLLFKENNSTQTF